MTNRTDNLLTYLRVMVAAWRDDPRGDAELLACFARSHDEPAFAALVGRHGSVVWQTCRRLLGDTPDAEDAFQATFLTLARRAGTFPVENLAGWLHRTAWQVATKLQASARRRRGLERRFRDAASHAAGGEASREELYAVLDEELAGLPERLRIPLVLRYLEGNSLEQVARVVGCSRRALGKRLAKGEAILRERLARRGLAVGAAAGMLFAGSDGAAAVPARLIGSTARAAAAFRAGDLTGVPPDGARAVLRRVPERALLRKGWWLAAVCACSLAAGVAAWQQPRERSDPAEPPASSGAVRPGDVADNELSAGVDRYGDPLPAGALARMGTTRWRRIAGPAAFTPDGKAFFTSGTLWDVATGKILRRFRDDRGQQPNSMIPSPGGRTFVSLSGGLTTIFVGEHIALWDIATGKALRQWGTGLSAIALSPDGKTVISAGRDGHVRFWEESTGKQLRDQPLGAAVELFSPDGKYALSTLDRKKAATDKFVVQVWDVTTGTEVCRLSRDESWDLRKGAAFSPDGKLLATGSGSGTKPGDGSVSLWEVATGKELRRTGPDPTGTWSVAFSPDGKLLAAGSGFGPIRLWDVALARPAGVCKGYCSNVSALAFSPDGGTLASLSDTHENMVRLWEVRSGKEKTPPTGGHTGSVLSVAFMPDDKTVVSGGRDGTVRLWDADTGRERRDSLRAGDFQAVVVRSADGKTIFSVGSDFVPAAGKGAYTAAMESPSTVRVWDAETGRERRHFAGPVGLVRYAALSPDGKTLALAGRGGVVLQDVATGKELRRIEGQQSCVAFSPDGKTLAVDSDRAPLALWDVAAGKKICDLVGGKKATWSGGLAFCPNGRTLASCELSGGSPAIRLWRLRADGTWTTYSVIPARHHFAIWALAFSPDGQSLASAGAEGRVSVWETATGGERRHFAWHEVSNSYLSFATRDDAAWSLSFAGDGRRLAGGNSDTTILVWDVTGRLQDGHGLRPARLSAAEVQGLWDDLAGSDPARADRAVWTLAAAPEQVAPLLREQLHPVPRVETVKGRVERLVADLDSEAFTVRRDAAEELQKLGETAEPALRAALAKTPSAEVRKSIGQLLDLIEGTQSNPSGIALRSLRALQVLGQSDTPEARHLLALLGGGEPAARLTQEARAVAASLRHLPDAPGP